MTGTADGDGGVAATPDYRALVRSSAFTVSVADADGRIVYSSGNPLTTLGHTPEELIGRNIAEFVHPADQHVFLDVRQRTLAEPGVEIDAQVRFLHADDRWEVLEATVRNLLHDPAVGGILITSRNVSRRHAQDRLLADTTAILEAIAADHPAELVARQVRLMVMHQDGVDDLPSDLDELLAALDDDSTPARTQARRLLALARSSQRTTSELLRRATADELTGLANRATFTEAVARHLRRSSGPAAVLLFDLDRFKQINDAYGHSAGDTVLISVAEAVQRVIRTGDVAARFGGDEFAVLCADLDEDDPELSAIRVGQRIGLALNSSAGPTGAPLNTAASVGVSMNRLGGVEWSDAEAWIADADHAMYEAKRRGRSRVVVADDETRAKAGVRGRIERGLRDALEQGGLEVWFQPIVALDGGRVVGGEALLRWRAANGALRGPSEFLPVAEESGLMAAISLRTVAAALEEANRWSAAPGGTDLTVAVNMSVTQLLADDVVAVVGRLLDSCGIAPERLLIELAEQVLSADEELIVGRLRELRALGVRLGLDDFGTGWTPLRLVRSLPFDLIKIDPSLTAGVGVDPVATDFAARVVELGRSMGHVVAAEGVEREEQRAALEAMGCELGQGWLFGPPLPPSEFLATRRPHPV